MCLLFSNLRKALYQIPFSKIFPPSNKIIEAVNDDRPIECSAYREQSQAQKLYFSPPQKDILKLVGYMFIQALKIWLIIIQLARYISLMSRFVYVGKYIKYEYTPSIFLSCRSFLTQTVVQKTAWPKKINRDMLTISLGDSHSYYLGIFEQVSNNQGSVLSYSWKRYIVQLSSHSLPPEEGVLFVIVTHKNCKIVFNNISTI